MSGIFVTGTDTDAGKTIVSAIIAQAMGAAYWKPVQTGCTDSSDRATVQSLTSQVELIEESYRLRLPLSPHAAADAEGVKIDIDRIHLPKVDRPLVVEGAGGLLAPLSRGHTMADLIKKLELPSVLVSKHYLGSINHTLLSLETLAARHIKTVGIIFIGGENQSTEEAIAHFSHVPILGRVPWAPQVTRAFIEAQARQPWIRQITSYVLEPKP